MNKLVILATYWNEKIWINHSLKQIELLDPDEVIICDGCFDPKFNNGSTDGTSQLIQSFKEKGLNVKVISAIRRTKINHLISWFKKMPYENKIKCFIPKLLSSIKILRTNIYRLNQVATFNYMLEISDYYRPGNWLMTYDADQFYSDEIIDAINNIENYEQYDLLAAKELTFQYDFTEYTDDYEKRDYNNMPHKIHTNCRFIPTRHYVHIDFFRYKLFTNTMTKLNIGQYFHYRFPNELKEKKNSILGDRGKNKESKILDSRKFNGEHPTVIQDIL